MVRPLILIVTGATDVDGERKAIEKIHRVLDHATSREVVPPGQLVEAGGQSPPEQEAQGSGDLPAILINRRHPTLSQDRGKRELDREPPWFGDGVTIRQRFQTCGSGWIQERVVGPGKRSSLRNSPSTADASTSCPRSLRCGSRGSK